MFKSNSFGTENTPLMVINNFLIENISFVLNCVYLHKPQNSSVGGSIWKPESSLVERLKGVSNLKYWLQQINMSHHNTTRHSSNKIQNYQFRLL